MLRTPRLLASVVLSLTVLGACGGENPYRAAQQPATTAQQPATDVPQDDNQYLPDRNVTDCVGMLERPNCGSSAKGRPEMYLVLGVLALGLGFVGWRVVAAVRRRDAVVNATTGSAAPGSGPAGE